MADYDCDYCNRNDFCCFCYDETNCRIEEILKYADNKEIIDKSIKQVLKIKEQLKNIDMDCYSLNAIEFLKETKEDTIKAKLIFIRSMISKENWNEIYDELKTVEKGSISECENRIEELYNKLKTKEL